jgi:hypothetical protein
VSDRKEIGARSIAAIMVVCYSNFGRTATRIVRQYSFLNVNSLRHNFAHDVRISHQVKHVARPVMGLVLVSRKNQENLGTSPNSSLYSRVTRFGFVR